MLARRTGLPFMILAVALSTTLAAAQAGGTGTGRGGQQGRGGFSPDRLMENDANGDGKLSREELPDRLADRIFDAADTNGDGFIDKAELEAFFAARGAGGRPGGPGAEGGPGPDVTFDGSMRTLGRTMRGLRRSSFDAESREADLQRVEAIQLALLGAKSKLQTVPMAPQAKAKYGEDMGAYRLALRTKLLEGLMESLKLEMAVMNGDSEAAKASVEKLRTVQDAGHAAFQPEDDDDAPRGRRGGRGGRGPGTGGGAGGGAGAGTGRGG